LRRLVEAGSSLIAARNPLVANLGTVAQPDRGIDEVRPGWTGAAGSVADEVVRSGRHL
jgi:hypothetical protein